MFENLKVKHHFTLIEYPQMNGQAEEAKQALLRILKRKL